MVRTRKATAAAAEVEISSAKFDAVLFDMDGVVTRTARVHMRAWKTTFDEFLKAQFGESFKPFTKQDYLDYVDGKPREEGVKSFLKSRKIDPEHTKAPSAPRSSKTSKTAKRAKNANNSKTASSSTSDLVDYLAVKKDKEFMHIVHTEGVEPYETTVALVKALRSIGVATALVTASRNGEEILKIARLTELFDTIVTGVDVKKLKLKGKPAPDVFLEAARRLSVKPNRAVVIEDAESGVQSGHAGHFKKVIGVAWEDNRAALKKHGATDVVLDLADVVVPEAECDAELGSTLTDLGVTHANWLVEYKNYDPKHEMKRESLCTLGNGKFFIRGSMPECRADRHHYPGTYLAGGYNTIELKGKSSRFQGKGNDFEREELVNMPNCLSLKIAIEDDESAGGRSEISVDTCELLSFSQILNLKEGILYRRVKLRDRAQRETLVTERRFVHMLHSHLAGVEISVQPINWSGKLVVHSAIDATVTNSGDPIDPEFRANKHFHTVEHLAEGNLIYLKVTTTRTKLTVAQAARTEVFEGTRRLDVKRVAVTDKEFVGQEMRVDCTKSTAVVIQKTIALCSSRDRGIYEAGDSAREYAADAPSFAELVKTHIGAWSSLWRQFDLFIETREEYSKLIPSLLLHLNSFHTLQTASMHTVDLDAGIPARGWTGEGYQGHIFWDELFVFPFINLRMPNITAALLKYRYRRLKEARKIAQGYGARGACFPWQSASDGKERTPAYWWMPSDKEWIIDHTHLEIHVNVAIAYNVWQFYQVTNDIDFMYSYGSEIILEIARFLATYAKHNKKSGRYEINSVIGPDEFHNGYPHSKKPGVNNNSYTNIMASWVFCRVIELLEKLPEDHALHLKRRLEITDDEISLWADMSNKMFVPMLPNGVIAQFEGYEKLKEFPGFATSGNIDHDVMKELLAKNAGYLNEYKVSKQADLLMLGFLFTRKELTDLIKHLGYPAKSANLEKMAAYYIPRTSNESTLSRVALAWVLSRLSLKSADRILKAAGSKGKKASGSKVKEDSSGYDGLEEDTLGGIFYAALGSDYYDVASRGTAKSGIHIGAMAGTVDIVQRCYTGLSVHDEALWLDPVLPPALVRLSFTLHYRDQSLHFNLNRERIQIRARHSSAGAIKIGFRDRLYELNSGESLTLKVNRWEHR